MLVVEHLVDRLEGDVLVAATVTTDGVDVEQLVVVLPAGTGVARLAPTVVSASGVLGDARDPGSALCAMSLRNAVPMRRVATRSAGSGSMGESRQVALDERAVGQSGTAAARWRRG